MQNGRGWADRHLSMVGGGGGLAPPPLENGKKRLSEEILTSHLCFTNEIRGDRQTLHTCKMEGGRRLSMVVGGGGDGAFPPPPENETKKAVRGNF